MKEFTEFVCTLEIHFRGRKIEIQFFKEVLTVVQVKIKQNKTKSDKETVMSWHKEPLRDCARLYFYGLLQCNTTSVEL